MKPIVLVAIIGVLLVITGCFGLYFVEKGITFESVYSFIGGVEVGVGIMAVVALFSKKK